MAQTKKPETPTKQLQGWLDDVAAYERAFKKWEARVEKILKRYSDERRDARAGWSEARFNILWSNVQTLTAATFSRLPKPDVSRRFRDQDPVGRIAALLLERALEYHVQHYPEYATAMRADVQDRFLGARGTAWVRYEPHFRAVPPQPADGDQVTEDVDTPDEELDYECVAVDYVHWRDFGHSVARTWEEVNRVWRKVYMTRAQLEERFGEEIAKAIPLDADPRQAAPDKAYGAQNERECATVYEGWDKAERRAVWFAKGVKDFLDAKDDPLGLEDVFPCPRPLYGTLTSDSLIPTPDFTLYQDQANELDLLSDRIDGLIKALKVSGGYDASVPELGRIFTEGENGTLIPVKNWAGFAEKNGLQGALSLVDLNPIAEALRAAYEAFEQVKNQVYEITGISDIIRGQSKATETATAQQLKGQYASLRLKTYQDEVARYASDLLSLMGQVICRKFSPETIAKIAGGDQLAAQDQPMLAPALELLVGPERMANPEAEEGPNPVREFRIEVAADSMVHLDEQAEQEARTEFLGAVGTYLANVAKSLQGVPQQMQSVLIPLYMDMLKFGVTGYRVGKSIEGAFDEAAERLKQIAQQPAQQQMDPAAMQEQMMQAAKAQVAQENATKEIALAKRAADLDVREMKFNAEQEIKRSQEDIQKRLDEQDRAIRAGELERERNEFEGSRKRSEQEIALKQERASFDEERSAHAQAALEKVERETAGRDEMLARLVERIGENEEQTRQMLGQLIKAVSAPKRIIRGPDGRASDVVPVQ